VKTGPFLTIVLPVLAWAGALRAETPPEPTPDEPPINWVDTSHAYATDQAQALTQWMDNFFGNPEDDLDQAESFLRVITEFEWDEEDGNDVGIRLRGKVQLPRISSRVDLLFSGEDDDTEDVDSEDRRALEDQIGVRYNVREGKRSRFDATLGIASGSLKPGVRYRLQDTFGGTSNYRFTQRLQYEDGENFYSTSQLEINRLLDENTQVRWVNRGIWGQHTDGVEWRSRASVRHRLAAESRRPLALSYYAAVRGVTRPDSFVKNYRLGVTVRRRIYRDFLFLEVEPAINFRRRNLDEQRGEYWSVMARLEIALERDLRRRPRQRDRDTPQPDAAPPAPADRGPEQPVAMTAAPR
jgi:hypothetical protein